MQDHSSENLSKIAKDSPIGIFDSGIGGLTVFKELAKILPQEDLIYLGDTARVPYGNKSPETVTQYALQNVCFLLKQKVKMVVVACNTASAFALTTLQTKYKIPILGVIEPGARGALAASQQLRIGVIGTEGTIKSEAYTHTILSQEPRAFVTSTPCPLFVPLVEEGWLEHKATEEIASVYLQKILSEKIDTLILGCTHYPLLKKTLQKTTGGSICLIDSAEETAVQTRKILEAKSLLRKTYLPPKHQIFVTDSPDRFRRVGEIFLKTPVRDVQHVTIEI